MVFSGFNPQEFFIMSKQASPMTVAIRKLYDANPEITHEQARPLLEEMGIEVAVHPGRISDEAKAVCDYETDTVEKVREALTVVDCDPELAQQVFDEFVTRDLFVKEANSFNVAKSNYKKAGTSGSKKPSAKRTRRTRKPKVNKMDAVNAMFALVQELGGVDGAKKRVEELQSDIAKIESAVTVVDAALKAA